MLMPFKKASLCVWCVYVCMCVCLLSFFLFLMIHYVIVSLLLTILVKSSAILVSANQMN